MNKIKNWFRNRKKHDTMSFINSSNRKVQNRKKLDNVIHILENASRMNMIPVDWEWGVSCVPYLLRNHPKLFKDLFRKRILPDMDIRLDMKVIFMIDVMTEYYLHGYHRGRCYRYLRNWIIRKCSKDKCPLIYKNLPAIKSSNGHLKKTDARSAVGKDIAVKLFGRNHNKKYRHLRIDGSN